MIALNRKRRKLPRPSDWGFGVTVCVAGMADAGKSLVLSCDSMISTGDFSGDHVAFKLYPLAAATGTWSAMMCGDDITHVWPVIQEANERLIRIGRDSVTEETVGRAFAEAYQSVRRIHAQDEVLSPFGITFEQFRSDGARIFADSYREVARDLMQVDLECQFLVAGFDRDGDGHILTIENPGTVRNHDPVGFWAIGSGANSALGILFFHSVRGDLPLARVLYHVCEAKFMAESALGVGKHTTVRVLTYDSREWDHTELNEASIETIRNVWEKEGKARVPPAAIAAFERELAKLPAITRRSRHSASQTSTSGK